MKKLIKILILLLILAGLGAFGLSLMTDSGDEKPVYRTDTITRGNITNVVTANGIINPTELVTVGTQVSGQVSHVYVKVNDEVKKGQLLAEIDPAILEAQLKQSRSNMETSRISFEQAARDLKRTQMLLDKDYVAKIDLEHAQQAYSSAQNSYESAKTQVDRDTVNLNYSKIYAPIDGTIISQEVSLGQTVAASLSTPTMYRIAGDMTKMKIDINLSEADISKIKSGMELTFTVDAFPDRVFNGNITLINLTPNAQQSTVTYTVTAQVDNSDKVLLPGMTGYVSITLSEQKDVLRIPATALRFVPPPEKVTGMQRLFGNGKRPSSRPRLPSNKEGVQTIYLLQNGDPAPVEVKTGATDDTYVEVTGEGIKEGDTVVTGIQPQKKK